MNATITNWRGTPLPLKDVLLHVGPGWKDIVTRLIDDLFKLGWDGQLCEIKEKFGGLRFYVGKSSNAVDARIGQAEQESVVTCESCGSPGRLRFDGWIKAMCDKCHTEHRQTRP